MVTFEELELEPDGNERSDAKCRVCFVTSNIVPFARNGVATANTSLARLLADAGHEVTVLFTGEPGDDLAIFDEAVATHYGHQINVVVCNCRKTRDFEHLNRAYDAFQWLATNEAKAPFDVIHFTECQGHGYYALRAKQNGTHFQNTTLAVTPHGSYRWCLEGDMRSVWSTSEMALDIIERRSIEMADVVLAPSAHMLQWMYAQGWRVPTRRHIQQNVLPTPEKKDAPTTSSLREIVFFGRLEKRKGLHHFLSALEPIQGDLLSGMNITILGEPAWVGPQTSIEYIQSRTKHWRKPIKICSEMGHAEALEYLSGGGRLAVIASVLDNLPNTILECLALKIPFICSRAGGIPEIIHKDDLDACSYPIEGDHAANLRAALLGAISRPVTHIPRFRIPPEETNRRWLRWHASLAGTGNHSCPATGKHHPQASLAFFIGCWDDGEAERLHVDLSRGRSVSTFFLADSPGDHSHQPVATVTRKNIAEKLLTGPWDAAVFAHADNSFTESVLRRIDAAAARNFDRLLAFPVFSSSEPNTLFLPVDTEPRASALGIGTAPVFVIPRSLFSKAAACLEEDFERGTLDLWQSIAIRLQLSCNEIEIAPEVAIEARNLAPHFSRIFSAPQPHLLDYWSDGLRPGWGFLRQWLDEIHPTKSTLEFFRRECGKLSSKCEKLNERIAYLESLSVGMFILRKIHAYSTNQRARRLARHKAGKLDFFPRLSRSLKKRFGKKS